MRAQMDQRIGPEALLQTGLSNQNDGSQYRLQAATGHAEGDDRWFLGIDPNYQYIAQGIVIVVAIALDIRKYIAKK